MAQDSNHDAPPPPYSETDIYSNSGRVYSNPSVAGGDDHTSTTTSERILTPPDTPRTNSGSHSHHGHGAVDNTIGFAQAANTAAANISPAVADYFASRSPPPTGLPADGLVHTVRIDQATLPDSLPYQHEWAARDVLPQDWATFINFLIPDHATRGNQVVLDRKIEAERQSEAAGGVTTASQPGSEADWTHVSRLSQAEAQRDTLKGAEPAQSQADQTERMFNAAVIVQQWNEGFFGPRKMSIHMEGNISQEQTLGSRDAGLAQSVSGSSYVTATAAEDAANNTGGWRSYLPGSLKMDDEGIRLGDSFVADSNGLKIGSIIMDSNGIRVGVSGDYPGNPNSSQGQQNSVGGQPSSTDRGRGRGFGLGSGAGGRRGGRDGFLGRHQVGSYSRGGHSHRHHYSDHHHPWDHHHSHHHGIGTHAHHRDHHGEAKGKGKGKESYDVRGRQQSWKDHERRRDSSVSSISSSSSSSSSSSGGSIGSLPAYDDIKPQALPTYVKRLESWLAQSDREFTKADVKSFKSEMKESKSLPQDPAVDVKALRVKAKEVRNQWRQVKKQQRRARREKKRERRSLRRSQRKERRDAKLEARRYKKEKRKGKVPDPEETYQRHPGSVPVPPVSPVPPIARVPPVGPILPVPTVPDLSGWHPFGTSGPFGGPGRGGGGIGRGGRGSFGGFGGFQGGRGLGGRWGGPGGGGPFGMSADEGLKGLFSGRGSGCASKGSFGPFSFSYSGMDAPSAAGESSRSHQGQGPPSYDAHRSSAQPNNHQDGGAVPGASENTQRLYERVAQLEIQISEIEKQAQKLQAQIDTLDSDGHSGAGVPDGARVQREALRSAKAGLEKQIEALKEQLDNAVERADEAFSKDMDSALHC